MSRKNRGFSGKLSFGLKILDRLLWKSSAILTGTAVFTTRWGKVLWSPWKKSHPPGFCDWKINHSHLKLAICASCSTIQGQWSGWETQFNGNGCQSDKAGLDAKSTLQCVWCSPATFHQVCCQFVTLLFEAIKPEYGTRHPGKADPVSPCCDS